MSDGDRSDRGGASRAPVPAPGPRRRARRCPVCKAAATAAFSPFCSAHCVDVDLGRWLAGDYRIPASDSDEGDGPESDGPESDGPKSELPAGRL